MKFVISTRGSEGDINPFVALARELKRRGHEVVLFIPSGIRNAADLDDVRPVYQKSEDMRNTMGTIEAGNKSLQNSLSWLRNGLNEQFEVLPDLLSGADALIAAVTEFAAVSIAEYARVPLYRVALIPAIPGDNPPPLYSVMNAPVWVNRGLWNLTNVGASFAFKKIVNTNRRRLGMSELKNLSGYEKHAVNILAISRRLMDVDPVWERNNIRYRVTGYMFDRETESIPQSVLDFIRKGEKPLYMGFGSAIISHPERVAEAAAKVFEQLGQRVIFSSGWCGFGKNISSSNIHVLQVHVPHQQLFPFLKGAITHVGSGTTHTIARAGIPQLALPRILDQFYWGSRIQKAGLGPEPLPLKQFTEKKFFARILDLLENAAVYEKNARSLAEFIQAENGVSSFADFLERPQK